MQPVNDPVTFDIIQNSLEAIADEMFAAMRKTAMSAIIYEVLDLGTGITDADGEIAASGAGIPAFIGVLDKAVKAILRKHRPSSLAPGDVFAVNDPYDGGVTHLNDIVLAMPVFVDGALVAWTATIAHFNDVGGMVPGSMSTDAYEIFQEGIRIPGDQDHRRRQAQPGRHRRHDRQFAPARLSQGRLMVGDRGGEDRRAPAHRARAEIWRGDVQVGAPAFHGLWRAGLAQSAREPAQGPLRARRGAGRRRGLQGRDRDHRHDVHRRPHRKSRPGSRARPTPAATA